jgi:hypothetical protein
MRSATSRGEGRSNKNPQWLRADPSAFTSPVDRFSKTQTPLCSRSASKFGIPRGAFVDLFGSLGTFSSSSGVLQRPHFCPADGGALILVLWKGTADGRD